MNYGRRTIISDVEGAKKALRTQLTAVRKKAAAEAKGGEALRIGRTLLNHVHVGPRAVVSCFLPIGSELDFRPWITELTTAGAIIVLPSVQGPGLPLIFREWVSGDELVEEPFGTLAPSSKALARDPDVLVVPLLGFDRNGYRIGYGGGFYDRSLESIRGRKRVTAVGVGYAVQEIPLAPRHDGDQPLDLIVTEQEVIRPVLR